MEHQLITQPIQKEPTKKAPSSSSLQTKPAERSAMHPILRLQRAVGNQAVQHIVRSGGVGLQTRPRVNTYEPGAQAVTPITSLVLQRKCACGGTPGLTTECAACRQKEANLPARMDISQPGDIHEQEADRVANQIMSTSSMSIHRKCACGGTPGHDGECEGCKQKRIALQRKSTSNASPGAPYGVHQALRSPGQSLDNRTRAYLEPRLGHDFSTVRVHTNQEAASSAFALDALAYTVGNHIVFAPGQYEPASQKGLHLLAHELTHVVQQGGAARAFSPMPVPQVSVASSERIQRAGGKKVGGIEGGAVGSLQFCINFCNGDYKIIGWIWVGAGTRILGVFVGPSAMYEGTLARGNSPSLQWFTCGECDPNCTGEGGWSGGIPFFKDLFKPDAGRQKLSRAGLECGLLFTASSLCEGAIEIICFLDVIQYLGPIGKSIESAIDRLNDLLGGMAEVQVKVGIDGGGTMNVCKGIDGGIVIPGGEICIGGFIELGVGLSTDKADYSGTPSGAPPESTPAPAPETPPGAPTPIATSDGSTSEGLTS